VIIASSVMTSHSMARLDYRTTLVAFTALHQAADGRMAWRLAVSIDAIRERLLRNLPGSSAPDFRSSRS